MAVTRRLAILVAGMFMTLTVVGCGSGLSPTVAPAPAVPNAYGLTDWHTNLAATTCDEFTNAMTPHDQIIAAAWLLASMRAAEVSDASDGRELAVQFAAGIMSACRDHYSSDPTVGMIAAATLAYTDDLSLHPAHD